MPKKSNIRSLSFIELSNTIAERGYKPYRTKQVYEWFWKKSIRHFNDMTNLPAVFREQLKSDFFMDTITIAENHVSIDKTTKFVFALHDKLKIESVLIPSHKRITACISSQVGCSLSCNFCATGKLKRIRNLTVGEIYDQYTLINQYAIQHFRQHITNVVFMGMGEPLLNYKNVLAGIDRLCSPEGLNIASKRITVSTAGISRMIKKMGDDEVKFNLALSLHAADDDLRHTLMPINEYNNLKSLVQALNYFYQKTNNQITIEYLLLGGINDTETDAEKLHRFAQKIPGVRVNVIEYNAVDGFGYNKSSVVVREAFIKRLKILGTAVTLRKSRGDDIAAACGQLAGKRA